MTIKEFANELNILIEASYGNKGSPDTRIPEIPLHDASWDECSYDDFWDDYKECEDFEGEDWIEE